MSKGLLIGLAAGLTGVAVLAVVAISSATLSLAGLVLASAGALLAAATVYNPFIGILVLVGATQQAGWTQTVFGRGIFSFNDVVVLLILAGLFATRLEADRPRELGREVLAFRLGLLYVMVKVLSALFAERVIAAGIETQKFIGFVVLFYLILRLTSNTRRLGALALAIVVSTAVSSGMAVFDYFTGANLAMLKSAAGEWGGDRTAGSFTLPMQAGMMMASGASLCLVLFLRWPRWRLLTGLTVPLAVLGVASTSTRTSLMVLPIMLGWVAFRYRKQGRVALGVAVLPLLFLLALPLMPTKGLQRILALEDYSRDQSAMLRVSMMKMALDQIPQHPLLGVGPDQSKFKLIEFQYRWDPGILTYFRQKNPYMVHNAYVASAVEDGLLGLALLLATLLLAWRDVRHAWQTSADPDLRAIAEAIEVAFVVYLMQAMAAPNHRKMIFWILIAVAVATARVARQAGPALAARLAPHPIES